MKFTNNKACCATCDNWHGQRTLECSTCSVETPTYSRGKCTSTVSPFGKHDTFYSLTCPNWVKWEAVK